jgi:hypothetical protein
MLGAAGEAEVAVAAAVAVVVVVDAAALCHLQVAFLLFFHQARKTLPGTSKDSSQQKVMFCL